VSGAASGDDVRFETIRPKDFDLKERIGKGWVATRSAAAAATTTAAAAEGDRVCCTDRVLGTFAQLVGCHLAQRVHADGPGVRRQGRANGR
jgi:hypothetical protein